MAKEFKNLDEQLMILKNKGLTIEDEIKAKEILLRENYFFLNGYRHVFMRSFQDRTFIPGSTFNELYALFHFDRCFRNIIFKNLLIVENNIKSIFSYQLSRKYGIKEKDYLRLQNFSQDPEKVRRVRDLIDKMKRQIRVNGSQHSATMHYLNNYGYIPLWVLVKVLSFGIVSELYSILKPEDQSAIAELYHLTVDNLEDFLPILANYRNLCAHEDIMFDHRTERSILNNIYHQKMKIPIMDNEYIYGKNDMFSVIIILKYMLTADEFRLLMKELEYEVGMLSGRLKSIPIDKILDKVGLPKNYMEIIDL